MKEEPEKVDSAELECPTFPLPLKVPLKPEVVTRALGTFERVSECESLGISDFPKSVLVHLRDGGVYTALLIKLYTDGTSQASGTYYFVDPANPSCTFHKFGYEIRTLTFNVEDLVTPTVELAYKYALSACEHEAGMKRAIDVGDLTFEELCIALFANEVNNVFSPSDYDELIPEAISATATAYRISEEEVRQAWQKAMSVNRS